MNRTNEQAGLSHEQRIAFSDEDITLPFRIICARKDDHESVEPTDDAPSIDETFADHKKKWLTLPS